MAIIEVHKLRFQYAEAEDFALDDISLQVEKGEFVAIIGANEAGKSTLCYTLSGFVPHFFKGKLSGSVSLAGISLPDASLNDIVMKVGLAFQNPFNQISGSKFTVYEEIAFGLENIGLPREEMRSRVDWIMELTGIQDLADRSPFALSGGQQQRVALASILVMKPEILVLDEPTSQLDPIGTREVFKVIRDLAQQGLTIVMAEHKTEWIAAFADRVIALDKGKIIKEGTPAEVLSDSDLKTAGIGLSRYTLAAELADRHDLWPASQRYPVNLEEAAAAFADLLPSPPQHGTSNPGNEQP